MNNEELTKRLLELQTLLLDFLAIERQVWLPKTDGKTRQETDTEHSYHLAMLGWYLCGFFKHYNKDKVIRYALAHDLVEIHAGDVLAIGRTKEQQAEKTAREEKALEKLTESWPDFNEMTETIRTYEEQNDPEAVFVKSLDKIMSPMLNILSKGIAWKELDIVRSDVIKNKDKTTSKSKEIQAIWNELRTMILEHDEFFNPGKAD